MCQKDRIWEWVQIGSIHWLNSGQELMDYERKKEWFWEIVGKLCDLQWERENYSLYTDCKLGMVLHWESGKTVK